ncbi:MAG: bifunctional phosphopantothenoylcysteine decarboxylase/phosphopantothenate--cysteine ligase CoaBC [Gammaproteobacteria bacterium]|nr:bifunctional phosphopantothenoylcysteine decarboxylase/phosphopantothenate--cysteine ligase CoaBC [Gammaproteobacteria bacterium]
MLEALRSKNILLGVTGGIAAYKSVDLVRRLRKAGCSVRVMMTENAKAFVTALTFQAASGHPVHDDLFDPAAEAAMGHIELARWADAILIAPATANTIAKLATGKADDLLSTTCLATHASIAIAPAMNQAMWTNPSTQLHLKALSQRHIHIFGPDVGSQACGETGPGRMLEPQDLIVQLANLFSYEILAGKRVMITAGPTREYIDPVRYLTNASSGRMGYALAIAAAEAGAAVTLISGPVSLEKPAHMDVIDVVTAQEMYDAVMAHLLECDIFIGVAAVSDFRPSEQSSQKIPKNNAPAVLNLTPNPDIIASVAASTFRPFVVGFAAETDQMKDKACAKLLNKQLDMIVANEVGTKKGFEQNDNAAIVFMDERQKDFPHQPKQKLARELITLIAEEVSSHGRKNHDTRHTLAQVAEDASCPS